MGVIFNEIDDLQPDFIKEDNPSAIESFGKVAILGNIDYLTELDSKPEAAWAHFDECTPGLGRLITLSS